MEDADFLGGVVFEAEEGGVELPGCCWVHGIAARGAVDAYCCDACGRGVVDHGRRLLVHNAKDLSLL